MISSLYSFDQLIQDIKTETGIKNLENRYNEIIQLIARAEYEINPYAGFLMKKVMLFYKGNGTFDGKSIKKPKDMVSIDKVGCCNHGLCDGSYYENVSHVTLCGKQRDSVKFAYWALQHDGNGYPFVSYNHASAVVAFVVWKLYSGKVFMAEGSIQTQLYLEQQFDMRCGEARGEDMFPSAESINNIYKTNSWSALEMFNKTGHDMCLSCDNCITPISDKSEEITENMKVYYWQQTAPSVSTQSVLDGITLPLILEKQSENFPVFNNGFLVANPSIGRLSFAIHKTELFNYQINDNIFGTDITDEFVSYYFEEIQAMVFVSINPFSFSNLNINIKKI